MAKWFYYNEQNEKIEVTGGQLKGLAKAGVITPDTMVETEEGKTAPARKVKGLTFVSATAQPEAAPSAPSPFSAPAAPPAKPNPPTAPVPTMSRPTSPAVPQSADIPVAVESKSSLMVTLIGIAAILVVGGLGWVVIKSTAPISTFTAEERAEIDKFLALFDNFGNDVKAVDESGNTLLHIAQGGYGIAVVKYLVSKGADVNAKNNSGQTPLHRAAGTGYDWGVDVVKYLVSHGADENVTDDSGLTPLDEAMEWNSNTAIIEYLASTPSGLVLMEKRKEREQKEQAKRENDQRWEQILQSAEEQRRRTLETVEREGQRISDESNRAIEDARQREAEHQRQLEAIRQQYR